MKNKSEKQMHDFTPSILRAYDIRGILGESLSAEDAYYIGKAFGTFIADGAPKKVCVGFDGRHSSPELEARLVRGLQETGAEVIRVGLGPTPMLYFAVQHFGADGGIMITGSHNPPSHNGFKMMGAKLPVFGDDILKLGDIAAEGEFVSGSGVVSFEDVKADFQAHLLGAYEAADLKVAWDAGNGAAGEAMVSLTEKLAGTHILLNEKIDGTFPSHHPDPSVLENMQQLIDVVLEKECDLGIAFDGDGDRIGVIDNKGNMLYGDQLMGLYAEDVLSKNPGGTVIADVKTSQVLYDEIARLGGKPIMWKTGHSLIKTKMAEENAVLGGEMSGHIFFAENFGFDDALYAAVKLLNIVAHFDSDLASKVDSFPKMCSTPEIRMYVDEAAKFQIVDDIKSEAVAAGLDVNDVDGVRALNSDGWWLVRASNTEAALVVRCESATDSGLSNLKNRIFGMLRAHGVEVG
jgi:phosphomannomutase